MSLVSFSEKEKAELFDEISDKFYQRNFGQMSKSDFELMMFHFYIEKLIKTNSYEDGTIDYTNCSDYKISKELGITQQRVRNLRVKSQLTYPIELDWKKSLAKLTENARYDKESKRVTMSIPDPNLYLDIQNFIESSGAYVEKQLNSKLLQLRAEYYIQLIVSLEPDENRKKIIKDLKKFFTSKGKENNAFDEQEIGKSLINAAVNVTEIIANITEDMSPVGVLWGAFTSLVKRNSN